MVRVGNRGGEKLVSGECLVSDDSFAKVNL